MYNLSSLTRNWTYVPCIARWILNHLTTSEVPGYDFKSLLGWKNLPYTCMRAHTHTHRVFCCCLLTLPLEESWTVVCMAPHLLELSGCYLIEVFGWFPGPLCFLSLVWWSHWIAMTFLYSKSTVWAVLCASCYMAPGDTWHQAVPWLVTRSVTGHRGRVSSFLLCRVHCPLCS